MALYCLPFVGGELSFSWHPLNKANAACLCAMPAVPSFSSVNIHE
jgi:hypothetical protein